MTHVCLVAPVALPSAAQILEMGHVLQWWVAADDDLVEGCLSCASLARLDGFVGQLTILCRVSKDVSCRGLAFAMSADINSATQAVKTTLS